MEDRKSKNKLGIKSKKNKNNRSSIKTSEKITIYKGTVTENSKQKREMENRCKAIYILRGQKYITHNK